MQSTVMDHKVQKFKTYKLLAIPAQIWFGLFLTLPVVLVIIISFATKGTYGFVQWIFQWKSYELALQPAYLGIFFKSIEIATVTATTCVTISFFMSWAMATATKEKRRLWMTILMLPFLTNLIIRIYAIKLFVGIDGPLQSILHAMNFSFDPFAFTANPILVFYGMITTYLPFALFPLYAAFEKFDFDLVESAKDLGANYAQIIFRILIPNLKPALASAFSLVFIPSLGEYVIPDLLGGAKQMYLGSLIVENFLKSRNWPLGAAVSIWIFVVLVLFLGIISFIKRNRHGRA